MIAASARRQVTLDSSAKHHDAGVVSGPGGGGDKREGSVHRGIQFCFLFDPGGHEATSIQRYQYRLIAFDLILAGSELAASGGRGPGDMAQLVAAHVVAHRFELPSFAAP